MIALGERDTLVDLTGKPLVTWKQSKASAKFDVNAFKTDFEETYKAYLREVPGSRRFLIK